MTFLRCTPHDTRLTAVRGAGLVGGNRLAVAAERLPAGTAGVLQVRGPGSGSGGGGDTGRSLAVRLVPVPGLPADAVVVPAGLVEEHRISLDEGWDLMSADPQIPAVVELELPAALSLDEAARMVGAAPLLSGHVFEYGFATSADVWIDVSGTLFRVRQVTDHGDQPLRGLMQIGPDTRLALFAPGARSGVDIVVLADCSGSMSIDDIPAAREGKWLGALRSRTTMTRMEALKDALQAMIDTRMRSDGAGTRFALVRFDHSHQTVFPAGDGMAEVADPRSITQLREAVSLLNYRTSGTDIGEALQTAGELLHQYGAAGNERLIVLVSDGAHWAPLPDERSGESVSGTQDPVSLMEDLHAGLGIRLHAIGISDERLFDRWWQDQRHRRSDWTQQAHESMIPNHRMLGELVEVADGDRHRVGGLDVLAQYFAELGTGVARTVGRPMPAVLPPLQPDAVQQAAQPRPPAVDARHRQRWETCVENTIRAYTRVCETSRARLGFLLYRPSSLEAIAQFRRPAASKGEFTAWLSNAYTIFNERLHDPLRYPRQDHSKLEIPALAGAFWDGRNSQLHELRNFYHHDRDQEARAEQNRRSGEIIHRHTGSWAPDEDDSAAWQALQLGLTRDLAALLEDACTVLQTAPDEEPADDATSPSPAGEPAGTEAGAAVPGPAPQIRLKSQGYD